LDGFLRATPRFTNYFSLHNACILLSSILLELRQRTRNMLIEEELAGVSPDKDTLLTIGVFDGVHLGHKYLLTRLKEQAKQQDLLSGVVTFRQHPQEVLSPRVKLFYLTSLEEKVSLLKCEGADAVIALTFTRELAKLGARRFVSLLQKYLRMKGLIVGPDFALGHGREGSVDALRQLGEEMDFSVTVLPPEVVSGEVVSSTAIRNALAEGDIDRVNELIGRHFSLKGKVAEGDKRGFSLGFPTANLEVDPKQALPGDGVYATLAYLDGGGFPSVTNIGLRPTFGGRGRTIETFIIDYHGDLYGHGLRIDFVERIREEKRFASAEELKRQLAEDVKQGKAILESRSGTKEKAPVVDSRE
jgi:riboflavin kinase/FMN adenylyltransferase